MADIRFSCPSCKQTLEAPPDMAGQACECPKCHEQMVIPRPSAPGKIVASREMSDGMARAIAEVDSAAVCQECGAPMEPDSVLCMSCGFHKKLGKKIKTDLG